MTSKNIIFLDIDEVLCTNRSSFAYNSISALDEICCRFLLELCRKHNCKIVIHSSWRFLKKGVDTFLEEINSIVPELLYYIMDGYKKRATNTAIYDRVESIDNWLEKYAEEEMVENYVIFDDIPLEFNEKTKLLEEHFVKIYNPNVGLDFPDYAEATKILKGDND